MRLTGARETRLSPTLTLRARAVTGTAEVRRVQAQTRGEPSDLALTNAAEETGFEFTEVVELELRQPPGPSPGARGPAKSAIELEVVNFPETTLALLHTDEQGVSRWVFPEPETEVGRATVRAGTGQRFLLPEPSQPGPSGPADQRGPLMKIGRRIVRIFAAKAAELLEEPILRIASRWEAAKRPYGLLAFPFDGAPSGSLPGPRVLVLVHGTFSTGAGGFAELVADCDALRSRYDGQMVAFNHPSLSEDPRQNAERLIWELRDRMPGDGLDLDLVTHSRGGLVARAFAGMLRGDPLLRVRRAVLAAPPLAGTPLADADHGHEMLDRYTNLVTCMPDGALGFGFETLLTILKLVYRGAAEGLPGLHCMTTGGAFLRDLAYDGEEIDRYFAVASNYKPLPGRPPGAMLRWAGDRLVDDYFGEDNDLVVPTEGAFEWSAGVVPAGHRLLLPVEDGVHHSSYFGNVKVRTKLLDWLA